MKALVTALVAAVLAGAAFCAGAEDNAIEVAKGSTLPGEGQTVSIMGNPLPLNGTPVRVGEMLPDAVLTAGNMGPVHMADTHGKVRIISVVPSLDTPTCDAQTHQLSEKDPRTAERVEFITISMDLPFAQARWAKAGKVKNVTFLSDYKDASFGMNNGLLIQPLRLLARAIIVTDKDNVVRYLQVVPEVTQLPDMDAAIAVAKSLL